MDNKWIRQVAVICENAQQMISIEIPIRMGIEENWNENVLIRYLNIASLRKEYLSRSVINNISSFINILREKLNISEHMYTRVSRWNL